MYSKNKLFIIKKFTGKLKNALFILTFLYLIIIGCAKKRDNKSGYSELSISEISQTTNSEGYMIGSFEVPSDGISFLLSIFKNNNSSIAFHSLSDPENFDILSNLTTPNLYGAASGITGQLGYANILVPQSPYFTAKPGIWTFKAISNDGVKLLLRRGLISNNTKISVQPFITGTFWSADNLTIALNVASSIFSKNNISISINDTISISESQYATVSGSFIDSKTSNLVSYGKTDSINLFFIEDYEGSWSGILGNAAGMPGSMGLVNSWNGVLISLSAHATGTNLDGQLLGETVTHEMGHQLGLFHTSESGGTVFDILNDTDDCPISKDIDNNGNISAEECDGFGADNVMFWTSWSSASRSAGKKQNIFSDQQIHVIKYSPISR